MKRHVLLALVGGLAIALAAQAAKPADSDPKGTRSTRVFKARRRDSTIPPPIGTSTGR